MHVRRALLISGCTVVNLASVRITAKLQAAAILPHGDFAWDPTLADALSRPAQEAARDIAQAARTVGQWLGETTQRASSTNRKTRRRRSQVHSGINPDLIFLSTPHGIALSNDFAVVLNDVASGSADIGADLDPNNSSPSNHYTVTLPPVALAPTLAADLLQQLQRLHVSNVTGISAPNENLLGWGEVIPLLLIPRRTMSSADGARPRQHLLWSHPLRRHTSAPSMVPELLHVGHMVGQWLESIPLNVAVIISGDLSHTHEASGPYGGDPVTAARMDAALGAWAAAHPCSDQARAALATAVSLQSMALSCGLTGFVLLHGMLCGANEWTAAPSVQTSPWNAKVLVNRNVTYYGMMVAQFTKV